MRYAYAHRIFQGRRDVILRPVGTIVEAEQTRTSLQRPTCSHRHLIHLFIMMRAPSQGQTADLVPRSERHFRLQRLREDLASNKSRPVRSAMDDTDMENALLEAPPPYPEATFTITTSHGLPSRTEIADRLHGGLLANTRTHYPVPSRMQYEKLMIKSLSDYVPPADRSVLPP